MVSAIFGASRRDAGGVEFDAAFEQRLYGVKALTAEIFRCLVRTLLDDVADGDDFRFRVIAIAAAVVVADPAMPTMATRKVIW